MKSKQIFFKLVLLASVISLLSACAADSFKQSPETLSRLFEQNRTNDETPQTLYAKYEAQLKTFDEATLKLYAPLNMAAANEAFEQSKKVEAASPNDESQIKLHRLSALVFLDRAIHNKRAVELHLKNAHLHFQELKKLNAPEVKPKMFEQIYNQFRLLNQLIEKGGVQAAINQQSDLIEKMLALEMITLKQHYLGEAEAYLNKAKALSAPKYAPLAYEAAKQAIDAVHDFMTKKYRDRSGIDERSTHATMLAKRSFYIASETEKLHKGNAQDIEQHISRYYDFLEKSGHILYGKALESGSIETLSGKLLDRLQESQTQQAQLIHEYETRLSEQTAILEANRNLACIPLETSVISAEKLPSIISEETNKKVLPGFVNLQEKRAVILDEDEQGFDSIEIMPKRK